MSFFNNKGTIQTIQTKSDVKRETSRPTKVYTKAPTPFEGVDGEQRLIDAGKNKYLYSKINGLWLKSKLSKPSESDESVATTTTESTSGTSGGGGGTTSEATTVNYNFTYDSGSGVDYLKGWDSYLEACKKPVASSHVNSTKLDAAHNGLANGSFLRESTGVESELIIPVGLTNAGHGYKYFATEQIGGSNAYYLFRLDYTGEITGVRSRLPSGISVTESGTTSATEITVAVAGNVEITESVRIYWKLNSAGSYGANDYIAIDTSGSTSTSWSDTYTFKASNSGLTPSASTAYKFKTEPRNTASQQDVGNATESEVITTPSSSGSFSVPSDFIITASGIDPIGNYAYISKEATLTNGNTGTNSTTVSWSKDSGSVLNPGFAISKDGTPGITGTANGGTGWNTGPSASKTIDLANASSSLYITFRHQYRESYVGLDANMSVTFSNTNGSVADNTDLDITMKNVEGLQ